MRRQVSTDPPDVAPFAAAEATETLVYPGREAPGGDDYDEHEEKRADNARATAAVSRALLRHHPAELFRTLQEVQRRTGCTAYLKGGACLLYSFAAVVEGARAAESCVPAVVDALVAAVTREMAEGGDGCMRLSDVDAGVVPGSMAQAPPAMGTDALHAVVAEELHELNRRLEGLEARAEADLAAAGMTPAAASDNMFYTRSDDGDTEVALYPSDTGARYVSVNTSLAREQDFVLLRNKLRVRNAAGELRSGEILDVAYGARDWLDGVRDKPGLAALTVLDAAGGAVAELRMMGLPAMALELMGVLLTAPVTDDPKYVKRVKRFAMVARLLHPAYPYLKHLRLFVPPDVARALGFGFEYRPWSPPAADGDGDAEDGLYPSDDDDDGDDGGADEEEGGDGDGDGAYSDDDDDDAGARRRVDPDTVFTDAQMWDAVVPPAGTRDDWFDAGARTRDQRRRAMVEALEEWVGDRFRDEADRRDVERDANAALEIGELASRCRQKIGVQAILDDGLTVELPEPGAGVATASDVRVTIGAGAGSWRGGGKPKGAAASTSTSTTSSEDGDEEEEEEAPEAGPSRGFCFAALGLLAATALAAACGAVGRG